MNILRTLLAKLVSFLYVLTTVFSGGLPINVKDTPTAPADFTPVVRFAVCSDVHLKGDPEEAEAQRLAKLINFMYDYSSKQEYKGFDALCVAGDFANQGRPEEYDEFNKIIADNLDTEKTELLTCLGNHEFISYRDEDASVGVKVFEEKMGHSADTSTAINGYHFILASYDEDGRQFKNKQSWMNTEIGKAVADTGDKPVFVFQHPAPFATIYGSINWGDFSITSPLSNYPQVVDFSGHSHYPINDPRSCWQGGYTAFGCGTLSYFETELDCIAGNFPYNYEEAAQFYIVEADAEGNVRVMPYDLITDQFFSNEYYLTDLANKNYDYSYAKMKARDDAPVFSDKAKLSISKNADGETILTFDGATDKYVVESYKVTVKENGITVAEDNFSGKYMYLFEENVYEANLGVLKTGICYDVEIVALNAYAEASAPLKWTFQAGMTNGN